MPCVDGFKNHHTVAGGTIFELQAVEVPRIKGSFKNMRGADPCQVLAALEVDRAFVGSAERGFCPLGRKCDAQPLGMPLYDLPLQRDGNFVCRIIEHGVLEQLVDLLLAGSGRLRHHITRVVGKIDLKEDSKSCKDT